MLKRRQGRFRTQEELRLLLTGGLPNPSRGGQNIAVIAGGVLVQDRDNGLVTRDQLKCVTKRKPTEQEIADCLFAWTVAKHVKSNAIVYARDGVTAGIGAGQMNRRDSARIAAIRAREAAEANSWDEPHTIGCGSRLGRLLPLRRRSSRGCGSRCNFRDSAWRIHSR